MERGALIGEGNTAQVFLWGEKEVIKLFREDFYGSAIEKEYLLSKKVEELGLPVPKVGGMVEEDQRTGILYEKIEGSSMLGEIQKKPWKADQYAKLLAEIHYKIHRTKIEGDCIQDYKKTMEQNILRTDLLSEAKKQEILLNLKQLPEGDALCHGDFHPGNVIMNGGKPVVIDWMLAVSGNPAADVARTLLLLKSGALPPGTSKIFLIFVRILRRHLSSVYLRHYLRISGVKKEEVFRWKIPIVAARLTEWVPDAERNDMLNVINQNV